MTNEEWRELTHYLFMRWCFLGIKGIYICSRDRVMAIGSGNLYFGSAPCNDNSQHKLI